MRLWCTLRRRQDQCHNIWIVAGFADDGPAVALHWGNRRRAQPLHRRARQNNGELKYESLRFEAIFVDPQDTDPRVKSLTRNSELGSCSGMTGDPPARLSERCFN